MALNCLVLVITRNDISFEYGLLRLTKKYCLNVIVLGDTPSIELGNRCLKIIQSEMLYGIVLHRYNNLLWGALGFLSGFNQVDNQMGGVYHRFQGRKCSRSALFEWI